MKELNFQVLILQKDNYTIKNYKNSIINYKEHWLNFVMSTLQHMIKLNVLKNSNLKYLLKISN
jgi:hypothetical protein